MLIAVSGSETKRDLFNQCCIKEYILKSKFKKKYNNQED